MTKTRGRLCGEKVRLAQSLQVSVVRRNRRADGLGVKSNNGSQWLGAKIMIYVL